MSYPANRLGRRQIPWAMEDVDPATELLEARETPERGEVPGHLDPGALDIPDLQNPWAALSGMMSTHVAEGITRVIDELKAGLEPLPLTRFASAEADSNGAAVVAIEYVPVQARWELGHLHVWHGEDDAVPVVVYLDTGDLGGYRRVDAGDAGAVDGISFRWPAMFLAEGHRLEVRASGLTSGASLDIGLFGRIHSAR